MNRFVCNMLLLGILPGLALAQGSGSMAPTSKSTPSASSDFTVTRTVTGSISNVSPSAKRLVIKDSADKLHMLKVADETKYQVGTKNLALQDLHGGQKVKVTYRAADSMAVEVHLLQGRTQSQ